MKYNYIWILTLMIFLQGCSAETEDREECIPAFESNFGFSPPKEVRELKLKNFGFRDGLAHWMGFTHDSEVFEKIVENDSLLLLASPSTPEHLDIINKFVKENPNRPSWLATPNKKTSTIFYKKDFLNHTYSEYYLWIDEEKQMCFIHVHYFD